MSLRAPEHLARARALTRVLDSAVRVPGTNVRFGLDAILGLVPGFGDVAGAALAGYVVLLAANQGAPASVVLRMLANVAIDTVVGTIPLLGDAFDIGWKSNTRNLALLERHLAQPAATRKASRAVVVGILVALALLIVAGLVVVVLVLRALDAAIR